jgi:aryl-phospho-beta-D-glucosidase BglC (GH1 family)
MTDIFIKRDGVVFDKATSTFHCSEKAVRFDTEYKVINTDTKNFMVFKFKHSTGPEFDPNTKWIYKNESGEYTLSIANDAEITQLRADIYLAHKTSR